MVCVGALLPPSTVSGRLSHQQVQGHLAKGSRPAQIGAGR